MKLFRYRDKAGESRVGVESDDGKRLDLSSAGVESLASILEDRSPVTKLKALIRKGLAPVPRGASLLAPVEDQEVWAAGVTYLRSKKARMDESEFSASAYDRVYEAARPEIFFKSLPAKVSGPEEGVGIRKDATWNVPEPELALVLNSRGDVVGYTIGNDMSSRDIEGENLLYLPQAKMYRKSCALGPMIVVGSSEKEARTWTIQIAIRRRGKTVFSGSTGVDQIKRSFKELAGYLFRSQEFPGGAILLTGTGVVPGDDFTLKSGDDVEIKISGIGTLLNHVEIV